MIQFREGEVVSLNIVGLDAEGRGRSSLRARDRHGEEAERPAVVPGAYPGEELEARIDHVSKRPGGPVGLVVRELASADPGRREPPCANHAERDRGRCDGCAWMNLVESRQREHLRTLVRDAHGLEVDEVVPSPSELGYRFAAKRVAFMRGRALDLGSFRRGSHETASMPGCLVDHPRIRAAADEIVAVADELQLQAYDERDGSGELRYVWLLTNGSETLLTLVGASRERASLLEALAQRLQEPRGVHLAFQEGKGNALRGDGLRKLYGLDTISLELAGTKVEVGPLDFLQPNPAMAERMYLDLVEGTAGKRALDLYAGTGITTELLRDRVAEVVPCERFAPAAEKLGVPPQSSEDFLAEWRERERGEVDVVVANPPRKGLGTKVVHELRLLGAPRLHIMACGPAGLAKDLAALSAAGEGATYRLESLRAYDTLPQTPHLELIAKLVRE